jgi:hypothetical protein
VEYLEQHPTVLNNVGMGLALTDYYRQRTESDLPPEPRWGATHLLHPTDDSPFVGDLARGQVCSPPYFFLCCALVTHSRFDSPLHLLLFFFAALLGVCSFSFGLPAAPAGAVLRHVSGAVPPALGGRRHRFSAGALAGLSLGHAAAGAGPRHAVRPAAAPLGGPRTGHQGQFLLALSSPPSFLSRLSSPSLSASLLLLS